MSDGPVHFIAHFQVHDADEYHKYEKGFFPILKAHGGQFVTYDDAPRVLEGEWAEGRTVIIRFESEDACMTWWNSEEYQELARFRHASTSSYSVCVVHALPSR